MTLTRSVLDSAKEIEMIDKSNMVEFCVQAPRHYNEAFRLAQSISKNYAIPENIIVSGMGGSAIGGEFLQDYLRDQAPVSIDVNRSYNLPAYADDNSLVLIVSYSGETEETLSAFLNAVKKGCAIFCISSGGSLLKYAEKLSVPFLQVPKGMPPRVAFPYLLVPQLVLAEKLGLVQNVSRDFEEAVTVLDKVSHENSPETILGSNAGKSLACTINGSVPIIYGFGIYRAVALRWKQQFNENAKIPSKWEVFSELNHNEIVGWENAADLAKFFSTVFLREKNESTQIRNRIEITKSLMPKVSKQFEVWAKGRTALAKMLSTVLIGDFTSVYLAVLRGVDPTPVETINILKGRLSKTGTQKKLNREFEKLTL